jgi:serine protease Do
MEISGGTTMERKYRLSGGWWASTIITVVLLAGIAVGSIVIAQTRRIPSGPGILAPAAVTSAAPVPNSKVSFADGFAPVVAQVLPSVVNIASTKIIRTPATGSPFFSDPFFKQFFGDQLSPQYHIPREQREKSLGSGVIVSPEGYILTNNHVVDGATDVTVSLADKREFKARIIGTDPRTDIAVLKVEAKNLPRLVWGDSSKVRVGNFAMAIGNPFGLSETVTAGIISATGRGNLGIEDYEDFIQTDASINPGNSGGALVDANGELIGINTAIVAGEGGGGNRGVGFAIPVNMARQVMDQILKNGRVIRGYLGAWIQPVTPEIAKAFNLEEARGALLSDVDPKGPAGKSGLQRGDVVLESNGERIEDSREFRLKIAMTAPGTLVHLKVFRSGTVRDISVTLGELPVQSEKKDSEDNSPSAALKGLTAETLTPQIAHDLSLPAQTAGVVVSSVDEGSAAAEAGLRRGDVIQEVNHQRVTNMSDFKRAIEQLGKDSALLLVNRDGNTMYIVVSAQ